MLEVGEKAVLVFSVVRFHEAIADDLEIEAIILELLDY